jgi:IS605 OrfB family transposase
MNFSYSKEVELKEKQDSIGIDLGYKKLAIVSTGQIVGRDFEKMCESITSKKKNSKAYKKALLERDNYLNEELKKIDLTNVSTVYAEDLVYVKHRTKQQKRLSTKFMNKLQYWTYSKALVKLQNICEEHGVTLEKVSPEYTSQQCSSCGHIDKRSRNGEHYHCVSCGCELDADLNAAINIHNRGVFRPFDEKADSVCI